MRPSQSIRTALEEAARQVQRATVKALASRAQVGMQAARVTVGNLARAGLLVPDGTEPVLRGRPLTVYRWVGQPAANDEAAA